jgi:hypothetical protein
MGGYRPDERGQDGLIPLSNQKSKTNNHQSAIKVTRPLERIDDC